MLQAFDAAAIRAVLFDVFGTVVDWRTSLIGELTAFGQDRGLAADWTALVDAWRGAYVPQMDRVRRGELPWTNLDALHRDSLDGLLAVQGLDQLGEGDRTHLTLAWHRLLPWPDTLAGLARIKTRYRIGTLSNGNVALLEEMAKSAGLPWDRVLSAEQFRRYKPDPGVYLGACAALGLEPGEVMLVAAHNDDLQAARALGLRTGFVPRPTEYGPHQSKDLRAEEAWDVVAADITDLAARLGA